MTATVAQPSGRRRSRAVREPHLSAVAIGARLREARELAGLTQRQLADGTGYTAAYVSRIENGERLASWSCLRTLVARLPVSAIWIEQGQEPLSVDVHLSRVDALELLEAVLLRRDPSGSGMRERLATQIRQGLWLPEPAPALQRLLAGELV